MQETDGPVTRKFKTRRYAKERKYQVYGESSGRPSRPADYYEYRGDDPFTEALRREYERIMANKDK